MPHRENNQTHQRAHPRRQPPTKHSALNTMKQVRRAISDMHHEVSAIERRKNAKLRQLREKGFVRLDSYQQMLQNMWLGELCVSILQSDEQDVYRNLNNLDDKITTKNRQIEFMRKKMMEQLWSHNNKHRKSLEQMNPDELQRQESRVFKTLTTSSGLSRKEENALNSTLDKIRAAKRKANEKMDRMADTQEIKEKKELVRWLKDKKSRYEKEAQRIHFKIKSTDKQLNSFFQDLKKIEEENIQKFPNSEEIYHQINDLVEKIKEKRVQLEELKDRLDYLRRSENSPSQKDSDSHQQNNKQEKNKPRKQKKYVEKTPQQNQLPASEEENTNLYDQEIEACEFLISYCENLRKNKGDSGDSEKKKNNIDDELKKGDWAGERGLEVIQSKKKIDKQDTTKNKKNKKNQKNKKEQEVKERQRLAHHQSTNKSFDLVKVVVPKFYQELDPTVESLKMKKEEFKKQEEKMKERKKKEKKNEEKGEKEDREDINKDFPALC